MPPDAHDLELEFRVHGFFAWILFLLRPFTGGERPTSGRLTRDRLIKTTASETFELPLEELEVVYRNTTSDSFACLAHDRSQSLLFPVVANADAFAEALAARGIGVEEETTSPERRFLR
jgi:hypothetical protein